MRQVFVPLGSLLCVCAFLLAYPVDEAFSASDPSGLTAGTLLVRLRGIGVFPVSRNTAITPIGGYVQIDNSIVPELDLSYFLTDHVAIEGEGGVTQNSLTAEDTEIGSASIGKVWSAPIVLVLQYHVLPESRWNPYFGAGLAVLPYFDAQAAGGLVQQLSVTSQVGATLEAGLDVHLNGPWYGNVDVKKLLIGSYASTNHGEVTATGRVNPWIVGFGIGYRF